MTIDHRKTFRDSVHAKPWNNISASSDFQAAANAAMLIILESMPPPQDMGTAAANAYRVQGARQFLGIITSLTDSVPDRKPLTTANLQHKI